MDNVHIPASNALRRDFVCDLFTWILAALTAIELYLMRLSTVSDPALFAKRMTIAYFRFTAEAEDVFLRQFPFRCGKLFCERLPHLVIVISGRNINRTFSAVETAVSHVYSVN